MQVDLNPTAGMLAVNLKDESGQVVNSVSVDLWEVNEKLYQLQTEFPTDRIAQFKAIAEYLVSLGLPRLSQWAISDFKDAIVGAMAAEVKKRAPVQPPSSEPS